MSICLVDLALRRTRTVTKAAKVNMPITPKSGNTHADVVLDSFFCVTACWPTAVALASYLRAVGAAVSQGLAGAGTGTGAGTETTGAQGLDGVGAGVGATVGGGVVVTVVTTGDGVVVTVVTTTAQQVASSHLPIWQTVFPAFGE